MANYIKNINSFEVCRTCCNDNMLPITSVVLTVFDITVIFDSIGASFTPISEVYLGEGNNNDQKKCARHSFILSIIFGCVFMIFMLLVAPYVPALCGVTSPNDVKTATESIRIFSLSMPFVSMNFMYFGKQYFLTVSYNRNVFSFKK